MGQGRDIQPFKNPYSQPRVLQVSGLYQIYQWIWRLDSEYVAYAIHPLLVFSLSPTLVPLALPLKLFAAHPRCYKIEPFPFTDKTPCSLHPKTHGRCTTDRPHCLSRCPNLQKPVMPHSICCPLPLANRSLVWTSPVFGRISANIGSLRCPLYVLLSP